jgi:hypothetical protein
MDPRYGQYVFVEFLISWFDIIYEIHEIGFTANNDFTVFRINVATIGNLAYAFMMLSTIFMRRKKRKFLGQMKVG